MERRQFLAAAAAGAVTAAAGAAAVLVEDGTSAGTEESTAAGTLLLSRTPMGPRGLELLRMQEDIRRALKKPVEQRKWVMVVNTKKCTACFACVVACMTENVAGPGVTYRSVPEVEMGDYPNVSRISMPTNCMQCDDPPCAKAANAMSPGAIYKRPDGIVAIDYAKFRDKEVVEAAQKACPYTAIYYDEGTLWTKGTPVPQPYEAATSFEYGTPWQRTGGKLPSGTGRKCHFCIHRLEAGMVPACVTTCDGGVTYFGDETDPHSLVSEILRRHRSLQLKEHLKTKPRVYYLVDDTEATDNLKTCLACHQGKL